MNVNHRTLADWSGGGGDNGAAQRLGARTTAERLQAAGDDTKAPDGTWGDVCGEYTTEAQYGCGATELERRFSDGDQEEAEETGHAEKAIFGANHEKPREEDEGCSYSRRETSFQSALAALPDRSDYMLTCFATPTYREDMLQVHVAAEPEVSGKCHERDATTDSVQMGDVDQYI